MKLTLEQLKRMIKQELLEVDLGNQVWSKRAHPHSRHSGEEPDTPIESDIFDQLQKYLRASNRNIMTDDVIEAIQGAMNNPKYNDVFIAGEGSTILRGQAAPRELVQKFINKPIPKESGEYSFSVNFLYNPLDWDRKNKVSSWTTSEKVAKSFMKNYTGKKENDLSVVFHAETQPGLFLDLEQIYHYQGLGKFKYEEEFLALGKVLVTNIDVKVP